MNGVLQVRRGPADAVGHALRLRGLSRTVVIAVVVVAIIIIAVSSVLCCVRVGSVQRSVRFRRLIFLVSIVVAMTCR